MALLSLLFLLSIGGASSASALSICPDESALFLYDIQSQCPVSIYPNPPLQVRFSLFYLLVLFFNLYCLFFDWWLVVDFMILFHLG
jgi:hypothetical protein